MSYQLSALPAEPALPVAAARSAESGANAFASAAELAHPAAVTSSAEPGGNTISAPPSPSPPPPTWTTPHSMPRRHPAWTHPARKDPRVPRLSPLAMRLSTNPQPQATAPVTAGPARSRTSAAAVGSIAPIATPFQTPRPPTWVPARSLLQWRRQAWKPRPPTSGAPPVRGRSTCSPRRCRSWICCEYPGRRRS